MLTLSVGRNNQRALRRKSSNMRRITLSLMRPTALNEELEVLNVQARELEQTIAANVMGILEA